MPQQNYTVQTAMCMKIVHRASARMALKVKTSFGNAPLSKNEMEALITNHVKEYVLTNTWSYNFCQGTAY